MQSHPDTGGDREVFENIQKAYDVLMDPEARAHYDATGEIAEKAADNAHGAALAMLSQAFDIVLDRAVKQGGELRGVDLVARMRQSIEAGIAAREKERANEDKARAKWRDLRDRFSVPDGQQNFMAQILESRMTNIDQGVRRLDESVQIARDALEILAGHEFRFDAPEVKAQAFAFGPLGSIFGSASTTA